ncbi:MAG: citryl-CoA lyase [Alphaproteobacteria bacterium]|nr:citryl-CoA lyase [Alphaproteobacteria bacterium]MDE2630775.1 citryl-CoA lyase [Alphaproteobacteria bacterium]
MTKSSPQELVDKASAWWNTEIIDIHPGSIGLRGYAVQDLLGKVTFPEMIWLMLRGDLPSPGQAKLLEAAMVASVDHGPHAPSIAIARMAVTCGTDINGAMASAVNVLADIHGGPAQQCMTLFEQIAGELERTDNLPTLVDGILGRYVAAHGKIIPGFGHRFHPVDPRAEPLLGLVDKAAADGVVSGRYAAIAREVAAGLRRRTSKNIPMNIDGATAAIFCELGFTPQLGRGLFILSRSVGILAHAWEQMQQGGRIKGPMPKEIPYTYSGPSPRKLERD